MLIAVANIEARSGKSICAVNLACELAGASNSPEDRWDGKRSVVLVDTCANGVSSCPGGRLPVSGEHLPLDDFTELERRIQQIRHIKVDYVLVDSPSCAVLITKEIVRASDLVVVPCSWSAVGLTTISETIQLIREVRAARPEGGPQCLLVPILAGAMGEEGFADALRSLGEPVGPAIHHSASFQEAMRQCRWIGDLEPDSAAHGEIKALVAGLLSP